MRRLRPSKIVLIWLSCLVLAVAGALVVLRVAVAPSSPQTTDGWSVALMDDASSGNFLLPGTPPNRNELPESCAEVRQLRRSTGGYQVGDAEMRLRVQAPPEAAMEVTTVAIERLDHPAPATPYMMFCNDMVPIKPTQSASSTGDPAHSGGDDSDGQKPDDGGGVAIAGELGDAGEPSKITLGAPVLLADGANREVPLRVAAGDRPYTWRLQLTVRTDGVERRIALDDQGKPFGLAPLNSTPRDATETNAADVAGEGWSDAAGLPNVFTLPGGPVRHFPQLQTTTYAGFGAGAAPAERVARRQVAWRRLVQGNPAAAPKGLTCAQLYHWLQGVEHVATGGEAIVVSASNTGDVNAGAVVEDARIRVLSRRNVPRTEQTIVECLQPGEQTSSGLANYRVEVHPSPNGEYPTSFVEATGTHRLLPRPPTLSFGNTIFVVFPPENDIWQTFVVDLDIRYGGVRTRVTLDDGRKPFESGSAWDGTAARTLAYCADKSSLGWTDAQSACTTQPRGSSTTPLPADLKFLVGNWGGRYRDMTVHPDGTGEVRLGNPPADPNQSAAEGTETVLGILLMAGPIARITKSNDPAIPIGAQITIKRTADPGILEIILPDSTWGTTTMCNPVTASDPTACG
jgi:hypothetical protein